MAEKVKRESELEAAVKASVNSMAEEMSAIPKATLNYITRIAAEKAIEVFDEKQKEQREINKGYRLKNTRVLVKKYKWLKSFSENAVTSIEQLLTEEDAELLRSMGMENIETRRLENMIDRVSFTKTAMGHVDTMLELYKSKCVASERDDVRRRWRVIEGLYLAENVKTVEQIAEAEHVNDRTVYKDVDAAMQDLSGLFFGIDLTDIFYF